MIIMKLGGGLGNQMFQYAAAISLAKKLECDFEFNLAYFKQGHARPYEMKIFGIDLKESRDMRTRIYWLLRKILKGNKFLGLNIYNETAFIYEEKFEEITNDTFIAGFFQSVKYFDNNLIKDKFQFAAPLEGLNKELTEKMQGENSVSLHIRRGDYTKARFINVYNQLGIEYYKGATDIISGKINNPIFYVFSDDPDWVKENLKIEGAIYVEHNSGENSWQDLRLMSNCKHNIIANSSFSFWGAFLNSNPDKIVIAPKKWFCEDSDKQKTTDIFQNDWILI